MKKKPLTKIVRSMQLPAKSGAHVVVPDSDFETACEQQTKLIYSIIVAGKSANFADKATSAFLREVVKHTGIHHLPFAMLSSMGYVEILAAARRAQTGNYRKLALACVDICNAYNAGELNLVTCKPEDLEKFHGIGPKTSRFFIMWIRPNECYAALDVHVLRWMRGLGYKTSKATPQGTRLYRKLELAFIEEARKRGKTPRELDMEIWEAGAGRTQKTATP